MARSGASHDRVQQAFPTHHGRGSPVEKLTIVSPFEAVGAFTAGKMSKEDFDGIEKNACPSEVLHLPHVDHANFIVLRPMARTWPAHTATRHSTTEAPILTPAWSHSPSFMRFSVCRLKEEKVV
jgi:hypothetical protein